MRVHACQATYTYNNSLQRNDASPMKYGFIQEADPPRLCGVDLPSRQLGEVYEGPHWEPEPFSGPRCLSPPALSTGPGRCPPGLLLPRMRPPAAGGCWSLRPSNTPLWLVQCLTLATAPARPAPVLPCVSETACTVCLAKASTVQNRAVTQEAATVLSMRAARGDGS